MAQTSTGTNLAQVKTHNRHAILQALRARPMPRVELAQQLGMSPTTVTNQVNQLLKDGWLRTNLSGAETSRSVGRPRVTLEIAADAAYVVGVQIGVGMLTMGLVDLLGRCHTVTASTFNPTASARDVILQIGEEMAPLIESAPAPVLGVGIGASGLVDAERGVNVIAPSLGWHDLPLAHLVSAKTNHTAVVENNVRAMALGEALYGAGRSAESLAFVFGRTGIAAGFVLRGELLRGTRAGAGEIGHTTMLPEHGERCRCGQHGCLETLVTQPALLRQLAAHPTHPPLASLDDVAVLDRLLIAAGDGDALVIEALERIASYLGIALTNLVNTLNPDRIVLGGMYAQAADFFLPRLRKTVQARAFGRLGEHIEIEAATFGLNAGVVGAAAVALEKLFYRKN